MQAQLRLYRTAVLLITLWLVAQLVLQLEAADATTLGFYARTGANVAQTAITLALAGLLLTSNTNRPRAIHPDEAHGPPDPFALDTPALLVNGKPYGRRDGEQDALKRAIDYLDNARAPSAPLPTYSSPEKAPQWVQDVLAQQPQASTLDLDLEEPPAPDDARG